VLGRTRRIVTEALRNGARIHNSARSDLSLGP
jgi:hypothetical protein